MKKTLRVLRSLVVAALSFVVIAPVALYILLSTPWAQGRLCGVAEAELSALLGTRVDVGSVAIHPFNRLDACDISVADDAGRECLSVERLSVRFELYHFLRTRRIVFDYALIDRPDLRVYRESAATPLNIEGISPGSRVATAARRHISASRWLRWRCATDAPPTTCSMLQLPTVAASLRSMWR